MIGVELLDQLAHLGHGNFAAVGAHADIAVERVGAPQIIVAAAMQKALKSGHESEQNFISIAQNKRLGGI